MCQLHFKTESTLPLFNQFILWNARTLNVNLNRNLLPTFPNLTYVSYFITILHTNKGSLQANNVCNLKHAKFSDTWLVFVQKALSNIQKFSKTFFFFFESANRNSKFQLSSFSLKSLTRNEFYWQFMQLKTATKTTTTYSVTRKKSPNVYKSCPKNDFTRIMTDFDTFTKIA